VKDALSVVKDEKADCEEGMDELRRQYATLTDDVAELRDERDALMKQKLSVTQEIEELNGAKDSLGKAHRDLTRQKEEVLRHIETLTKKTDALKSKLQQQESLLQEFETRRVSVQGQINAGTRSGAEAVRNYEAGVKIHHRNVDSDDDTYAEMAPGGQRQTRSPGNDRDDIDEECESAGLVNYRRNSAVVKAHVAKKQLLDEIEQLDERKREALVGLGEVKKQVEEVQHKLKECRSEWEEADTRCDIAQIELEQMELRYVQVASDVKDAETRSNLAREELERAQHRHAEVCSAIGDAEKRLDKIKTEVRGMQHERKQMMVQVEDAQRRRSVFVEEIEQLVSQQKELQREVDGAKVLSDTLKRLPESSTQTQTQIHELGDGNSRRPNDKPRTHDGDDIHNAEIHRLNSVIRERESEVRRLGVLLEDKGAALASLELRKTELERQVNMLEV
jgi:chromosome segregation ATPase